MIRSQIITASICLVIGFGTAFVLFANTGAAETSGISQRGGGQARAGGGHSHGGGVATSADIPRLIEPTLAATSRALDLTQSEQEALRLAMLKQNYFVRQELAALRRVFIGIAHLSDDAPDSRRAEFRASLDRQIDKTEEIVRYGRAEIFDALPPEHWDAYRHLEASGVVRHTWIGR